MKEFMQMILQDTLLSGVRDLDDRFKHPGETEQERKNRRKMEEKQRKIDQRNYEHQIKIAKIEKRRRIALGRTFRRKIYRLFLNLGRLIAIVFFVLGSTDGQAEPINYIGLFLFLIIQLIIVKMNADEGLYS